MITNNQAINLAQTAIGELQDELIDSFGSFYNISAQELIRLASERDPSFMVELGKVIYAWMPSLTPRRQREALERVASRMEERLGQGPYEKMQLVPTLEEITKAYSDEMTSFDFGMFPELGIEIAKDVSSGSVKLVNESVEVVGSVGKGLGTLANESVTSSISIIKDLPKYLPWILGGLVLIVGVFGIGYIKKAIPK